MNHAPFLRPFSVSCFLVILAGSLSCLAVYGGEPLTNKTVVVETVKPHRVHLVRGHKVVVVPPEAQVLIQAYRILERADHDYKGHRKAAMIQIEDACKALHVSVHGDGRAGESQAVSDGQLQQARGLLDQVRPTFVNRKQTHIVKHIDAAEKQITLALAIK